MLTVHSTVHNTTKIGVGYYGTRRRIVTSPSYFSHSSPFMLVVQETTSCKFLPILIDVEARTPPREIICRISRRAYEYPKHGKSLEIRRIDHVL